ncbi:DMT family transporter [Protaetiibacter intestinalis]|uniref:EamA/RhaT family transporter n=1 Tax=Protaetiibacter intestinalis TaxID=2419774 RepID=A0A387BKC9_9MICO|nr:EamA family transporter [Protaetiibacter intestinalis]AYF98970.1 EamA/RhaT family transporter [Protaetiibacter intestinalis]
MEPARARATLAIVVAALLWGTTGTAASFLPDAVSPLAVGAATMGVGGALLFATAPRASLGVLRDARARGWVLLGAVGVFAYPLAFYSGMDLAGVAIGNVVALGSGPIVTGLLERIIERHPLSARWAAATALAVAGVVLLSTGRHPEASGAGEGGVLPGVLLGLVAGAAYGLYTYASARGIGAGRPSRAVMGAMFGCGAVLLLPVLLLTGAPLIAAPASLGIAAYLALGPMFVAYLLVGVALRTLRSSTVTTIALLEPVVATVLAVVVVGERLGALGWLGIAVILAGIALLVTARPPRIRTRAPLDFEP